MIATQESAIQQMTLNKKRYQEKIKNLEELREGDKKIKDLAIKDLEFRLSDLTSQFNSRGKDMDEMRSDLCESMKSQLKLYQENQLLKDLLRKYVKDDEEYRALF
jgi:L-lactate utilization protein LutB